ncbi:MAG TPA: hypothetical protein VLM89_05815, partial [Phycisphaerae bacterium]|nr:hypothetical protein [Phycisphaerae bacterium]
MDSHKRITRMLAALVASMTVGALCLDWMLPVRPMAPNMPGIELMAVGPATRAWEGIRIETRVVDDHLRAEEAHFLVYRNGNPVRTVSWETQRVLDAKPIVRVALLAPPG